MPRFSACVAAVATGAVVATYTSLLGLKFANTAGHRGRLRRLIATPAGEAAQDVNVSLRVTKADNTGDGTASSLTPKPLDSAAIGTNATGKHTYTVEPTTVDAEAFVQAAINGRGGIVLDWGPGEGPLWGKNETLLVRASPGAASAVKLDITVEWDEGV